MKNKNIIWILSNSVEKNKRFIELLLDEHFPNNLIVAHTTFGSSIGGKCNPPPLAANEQLCAAIFIIEKEDLDNEYFRYWANWCIVNVSSKPDFRLYVCSNGLTIKYFKNLIKSTGDKFLTFLMDTVQLTGNLDPDDICTLLENYIKGIDKIRSGILWRNLRIWVTIAFSRIAKVIQFCCGFILIIGIIGFLIVGRESTIKFIKTHSEIFAVIIGIFYFPFVSIPIGLLCQGFKKLYFNVMENQNIKYSFFISMLLGPALNSLLEYLKLPISWYILGIAFGVIIDILRRSGYQACRANIKLGNVKVTSSKFPEELVECVNEKSLSPWRTPLFPTNRPRIFISYTQNSEWGKSLATNLYNRLRQLSTVSYFDQESNEGGECWPSKLTISIADTNVFIVLLDENTLEREWVATEIITALKGMKIANLPEIVILIKKELSELLPKIVYKSNILPVFKSILSKYSSFKKSRFRFIVVNESTIEIITSMLKPGHLGMVSVFPPLLAAIIFYFFSIPLIYIGTVGTFIAIPTFIFSILHYGNKIHLNTLLSSWGIFPVVYLLCAYWLGFMSRLIFSARFEVKSKNKRVVTCIQIFSSISFLFILGILTPYISDLMIGWGMVLCWSGWLLGNFFIIKVVNTFTTGKLKNVK